MSKLQNYSNKSFSRMIRTIRKVMPVLSATLLIGVYLVSAAAGGMFLANLMSDLPGGVILAFCIGGAIQATRAALVFFAQLNPNRPSFSNIGEVVAVIMGLISIGEILSLVAGADLSHAVGISLSILMAAGVGIELFLLREIKFATELELFENREYWQELKTFYQARKEFKNFLGNLDDIESEAPVIENREIKQAVKKYELEHALGNGLQLNGKHPL